MFPGMFWLLKTCASIHLGSFTASNSSYQMLHIWSWIHTTFPKYRDDMDVGREICSPWSAVLSRWHSSVPTAINVMQMTSFDSCSCGFVIRSLSVCSYPPCAPRAFPSEYGLLFQTPGIASGTLLACLMWAEQRGNKEYRNLQIIMELKTCCPLVPTHKVLCSISKHLQTFSLLLMLVRQTHAVFSTLGVGRGGV